MSNENNFALRLHAEKDKDVLAHVQAMKDKDFNIRQIFVDAVRRNLGVTPELFHENQRSLTLGDLKGLLSETVDILETDIGKVLDEVQSSNQALEDFIQAQRELTRSLFAQVASGELSVEQANESFDSHNDDYALKLMSSLENRYAES